MILTRAAIPGPAVRLVMGFPPAGRRVGGSGEAYKLYPYLIPLLTSFVPKLVLLTFLPNIVRFLRSDLMT
jgi:hypothetical protein